MLTFQIREKKTCSQIKRDIQKLWSLGKFYFQTLHTIFYTDYDDTY